MDREALIQFIEVAFDGVEQPADLTLHVGVAHGEWDYDHDAEHRNKDFVGPWQEIPVEHLRQCHDALSFVDAVGMRYYLPAYMVWYIKNFGNHDEVEGDYPLWALDVKTNDAGSVAYHKDRFSLFNPLQLEACARFVRFCAEDETGFADAIFARKEYDRYWKQFEPR